MDKIMISVVIPVYNEQDTMNKCLKTLLNQSLPAKEIIVIDDGSTDTTIDRVKHLQAKHTKIKLYTQEHLGPAIARNTGAKYSQGDVLVFVDGDMEFESFFLENLTEPILNKKAIGSWSGNEWVKNWDNVYARCFNYNQGRSGAQMISATQASQKKVYRAILKTEFKKVKGFEPTGYTDDWTLVEKIGQEPYITQAKFYHYHPDNLREVFIQATWMGQRQYKLGKFGTVITIIRSNFVFSLLIGAYKAIFHNTKEFIIFKIVYDLGITLGAIKTLIGNQY